MRQTSELFTRNTTVNANTLISRRESYRLVINNSACSKHIESASQQLYT